MGAAAARAAKLTGKGVTVAVVDSGCDATHPDLADHVAHNVKLVGAEYANVPPDSSNTIVVPIEVGPYRNTDLGSGHGTHVAGIIAADGTTGPDHLGVAPDADPRLLRDRRGALHHRGRLGVRPHARPARSCGASTWSTTRGGTCTSSTTPATRWPSPPRRSPTQNVTVVFAAGNAGGGNAEASLNPFSQSPWVLSVAAGHASATSAVTSRRTASATTTRCRSRSAPAATPTFTGNRIGVVHPDVTAPGVAISSSCDTAGTVVGPLPTG